jgi:hypothetical protein
MNLTAFCPVAAIVIGSISLLLISTVALIAAGHRDNDRRADAARVLDRLLRAVESVRGHRDAGAR